jgi:sensor histidine kinase YesM
MDSILLDDFRKSMDSISPDKNEFIFTSQGDKHEAAYRNLANSDWKLVWIATLSNITEGARQSTNWTLLIAFASLAISLIFSFPVMRIVLTPLYKLKTGMLSLGRGSYIPIPSPYNQDEFGFLIKSYNQMLNELQRMELEVFQSKIKEKERELLQLQAQINPHFLFNTLETIDSYATKNNSEAVGEMVQSVSRMMRYNVQNDGGWALLKDEIAYIRNFLQIHFYRNGKDVNVNFELDPSVLNVRIMKLSMQPFVENAIKYGWSPHMSDEAFTLTIKAEQREGFLLFGVLDTGTGISEEIMDKLTELIDSKTELVDPYFQKHTGIFNVFRRFLLAYGNQVTFKMTTSPDQGTCVQIKLPLDDAKA